MTVANWMIVSAIVLGALALLFIYDRWISKDNIIRNFPIVGHLRYLLIEVGPEMRQYIVAHNREEAPFNREERDWIYRSADGENNMFGFGTDDYLYKPGYPLIKHAMFPYQEKADSIHKQVHQIPCSKVLGEINGRNKSWRPQSIVNISAMSFGALGEKAVQALNKGASLANCFHNSGEGGLSPHHMMGGDVIFQVGTGYFGARDDQGRFSMDSLLHTISRYDKIRGIEIKLSQGAKPGKGGVLPGKKVTPQIAEIRGVRPWQDCISPNGHSAFGDVPTLIKFIEDVANATGLPVGIKAAVGHLGFWAELAQAMKTKKRGPDWITIDGGEGGTGAAPLTFSDHVSLPYKIGFTRVYKTFLAENMAERVVWIGSGKLGFPDRTIVAMALGADMVNIAREAMLAVGCIQSQKCHTGHCPAGVATQNKFLQHGLDPKIQSIRFSKYIQSLRNEILAVTHACGHAHPSEFTAQDIEMAIGGPRAQTLEEIFGYSAKKKTTLRIAS